MLELIASLGECVCGHVCLFVGVFEKKAKKKKKKNVGVCGFEVLRF